MNKTKNQIHKKQVQIKKYKNNNSININNKIINIIGRMNSKNN